MKKITLLFIVSFIMTLSIKAQVISTVFGSKANEAAAEWNNSGLKEFISDSDDNTKLKAKAGAVGRITYTGKYFGVLAAEDVIYIKIRRTGATRVPEIGSIIVSYKQDGRAETTTLTLPSGKTSTSKIKVAPGFISGATLSELSLSFTQADGASPAFDVLRLYEFVIGPDPTN